MPDFSDQPSPEKKHSCLEMLQLIIDGNATPDQQKEFKEHLEKCFPCNQSYELEMALRQLLKSKCSGNGAPPDLIQKIKTQISQNIPH